MEYFHNTDTFLIGILILYIVKYSMKELGMGEDYGSTKVTRQNTQETQENKNSLRISGAKPSYVVNGSDATED